MNVVENKLVWNQLVAVRVHRQLDLHRQRGALGVLNDSKQGCARKNGEDLTTIRRGPAASSLRQTRLLPAVNPEATGARLTQSELLRCVFGFIGPFFDGISGFLHSLVHFFTGFFHRPFFFATGGRGQNQGQNRNHQTYFEYLHTVHFSRWSEPFL